MLNTNRYLQKTYLCYFIFYVLCNNTA